MTDRHLTRTAVFVVLEKNDEIFFLRRANTGWADGLLTVPAGHVDKGDQIREAAIKEVSEEAGVEVLSEDLEFIHVDFIRDAYTNFYFHTTKWQGEPKIGEPHLASEALWIHKDYLPDDLTPQLKNLFIEIKNKSYFSELERNK